MVCYDLLHNYRSAADRVTLGVQGASAEGEIESTKREIVLHGAGSSSAINIRGILVWDLK